MIRALVHGWPQLPVWLGTMLALSTVFAPLLNLTDPNIIAVLSTALALVWIDITCAVLRLLYKIHDEAKKGR